MAVSSGDVAYTTTVSLIERLRLGDAPYTLIVTYDDGQEILTDMTDIIHKRDSLAVLRPLDAFAACHVTFHGTGVEWDAGPDFSADALRHMGEAFRT